MPETKQRLAGYMRQAMAEPFCFGKTDCSKTADGWIQSETGISPLDAAGYEYDNEPQAAVIAQAHGGLARATINAMRLAGFKRTKAPQSGDVGAVEIFGRASVGIFDGNVWMARTERGVDADARARVVCAWRIAKKE